MERVERVEVAKGRRVGRSQLPFISTVCLTFFLLLLDTGMCTCVYTCVRVCTHVCIFVYMYTCMFVCNVYVYIFV